MKHLRRIAGAGLLTQLPAAAWACRVCRPRVDAGIYDAGYQANLLLVLLPVLLLLAFVAGLYYAPALKRRLFPRF